MTSDSPLPVMRPLLPAAPSLLPYLDQMDHSRIYSNFGPLTRHLEGRLAAHFGTAEGTVTTVANATLGLVVALSAQHPASTTLRFVLLRGFMGAFTTFSSYVFDTYNLLARGRTGAALLNLVLQNGLGLLALFAGLALGKRQ